MWPLDPAALELLGRAHGVQARLWASVNGSGFTVPVPLLAGGSVAVDTASPVRRTLDCKVALPVGHPAVDPLSAELRAEVAVVNPSNGQTWWTPVGTFVVTSALEERPGVLAVKGADRYQRVLDARFERPVSTAGSILGSLVTLLEQAHYRITVDTTAAPVTRNAASTLWERDRDEAVRSLATALGAEVVFDPLGVARVRPVPTVSGAIAWRVGRGRYGVKIGAQRGASRERTYNAIAVTGEPENLPPVYAIAHVTTGPLRWGGPFGKRPRFYRSTLIETAAQAQAVADSLIARVQGVARTLELDALPNPALDGGDVLQVEVAPGLWQRHLASSFTVPLGLGSMPIATRTDADEELEPE